jgi:hypothetical protein
MRGDVGEVALGHEATADVLANEDVARLEQRDRLRTDGEILVGAVGAHTEGRAEQQDRVNLRRRSITRHEHCREEPDPVTHGNAVLVFHVVLANVVARFLGHRLALT